MVLPPAVAAVDDETIVDIPISVEKRPARSDFGHHHFIIGRVCETTCIYSADSLGIVSEIVPESRIDVATLHRAVIDAVYRPDCRACMEDYLVDGILLGIGAGIGQHIGHIVPVIGRAEIGRHLRRDIARVGVRNAAQPSGRIVPIFHNLRHCNGNLPRVAFVTRRGHRGEATIQYIHTPGGGQHRRHGRARKHGTAIHQLRPQGGHPGRGGKSLATDVGNLGLAMGKPRGETRDSEIHGRRGGIAQHRQRAVVSRYQHKSHAALRREQIHILTDIGRQLRRAVHQLGGAQHIRRHGARRVLAHRRSLQRQLGQQQHSQ